MLPRDLHTTPNRSVRKRIRPEPQSTVFNTGITNANTELRAHINQLANVVLRAKQRMPDIKRHNLTVARTVSRDSPLYQRRSHEQFRKLLSNLTLPPGAHEPSLRLLSVNTNPKTGRLYYPDYGFAGLTDGNPVRSISIAPSEVRYATETPQPTRASLTDHIFGQETYLHELAHTLQSPKVYENLPVSEGGAEAFMWHASKKLGLPPLLASDYRKYSIPALRRGRGWALRGQFTRPGG